jgi:3-oxoacyl-[acyl-carrier protein] reductase
MNRFEGKNVVITGSSRGIGLAILEQFAKEGANIAACSNKQSDAVIQKYKEISDKNKVEIVPYFFDMSNEEAVKEGVKEIKAVMPVVDVLVNNAGISHVAPFMMSKMDDLHQVFQVNYFSQMVFTQGLLGSLKKAKGAAIVNMTSIAGLDGGVGVTAYGSSKAAIALTTKVLAQELALFKIRVNGVAPGMVETDMAISMGEKAVENTSNAAALKRLAQPEEIAQMVVFLASDQASYITGQIVRVDGGVK